MISPFLLYFTITTFLIKYVLVFKDGYDYDSYQEGEDDDFLNENEDI